MTRARRPDRWLDPAFLARLLAGEVDRDRLGVLADALLEAGAPLGGWLAAFVAQGRFATGSADAAAVAHELRARRRRPRDLCEREGLSFVQDLLLGLSADGALAPIADEVAEAGDDALAFALLSTMETLQVDELASLEARVVRDLRTILDAIEVGSVTATFEGVGSPREQVGYVWYTLSNGYALQIYNRVYAWHYLAGFRAPAGCELDLTNWPLPGPLARLSEYAPDDEVLARAYGW